MLRYFLLIPAMLAVSSTTDAHSCIVMPPAAPTIAHTQRACKLAVLDFDGPPLADAGRTSFVAVLGGKYEVVPLKRWIAVFEQQPRAKRWQEAAKRTGVAAVVEGWVTDEGRRHVMTIVVRDASTGNEIDSVSTKVNDKGVVLDEANLMTQLDDILEWADCETPHQTLVQ